MPYEEQIDLDELARKANEAAASGVDLDELAKKANAAQGGPQYEDPQLRAKLNQAAGLPTVSVPLYNAQGQITPAPDKPLSGMEQTAMAPLGWLAGGHQQLGQGLYGLSHPESPRQMVGAASDVIRGGMTSATPYFLPAMVANPINSMLGLGTFTAAQQGIEWAGEKAGIPDEYNRLLGDLVGMYGGAKVHGWLNKLGEIPDQRMANSIYKKLEASVEALKDPQLSPTERAATKAGVDAMLGSLREGEQWGMPSFFPNLTGQPGLQGFSFAGNAPAAGVDHVPGPTGAPIRLKGKPLYSYLYLTKVKRVDPQEALKQVLRGAYTGAMEGMGPKVSPEKSAAAQEVIELGQKYDVPLMAGDVSQEPSLKNVEIAGEKVPFLGVQKFRETQQTKAKTAAAGVKSQYEQSLLDTDPSSSAALEEAANAGDNRARNVLEKMNAAGNDPDRIIQASIGLGDWTTRQTATELYDHVQKLAEDHGLGDVPLDVTGKAINGALEQLRPAKLPNKEVIRLLQDVKDSITAKMDKDGKPVKPNNSYALIRQLRSDLGDRIRDYYLGNNALIGEKGVGYLERAQNALEDDMRNYARNSGVPEIVEAGETADGYYKSARVPYKNGMLAAAATSTEPDQVFQQFIKAGKGDRAQNFYNALDERGRAAVRYNMVSKAVDDAINPQSGIFSPQKFFTAVEKLDDAYGVFFTAKDKAEVQGFKNLMGHVIRAGQYAENPPTGQRVIPYLMGGAAVKGLASVTSHPLLVGGGVAALGMARALFTTTKGRNLLLRAYGIKPGTRLMDSVWQEVGREMPRVPPRGPGEPPEGPGGGGPPDEPPGGGGAPPGAPPAGGGGGLGLKEMGGGMAEAMTENLYKGLWDKVQKGDVTEAGGPSALLQAAKLIRDRGGMRTPADLQRLAQDYGQIAGTEGFQQKMRALVEKHSNPPGGGAPPAGVGGTAGNRREQMVAAIRSAPTDPKTGTPTPAAWVGILREYKDQRLPETPTREYIAGLVESGEQTGRGGDRAASEPESSGPAQPLEAGLGEQRGEGSASRLEFPDMAAFRSQISPKKMAEMSRAGYDLTKGEGGKVVFEKPESIIDRAQASLNESADAAWQRIQKRGNLSGTKTNALFPVDDAADMAIWGASKIMNGTINLAKWSKEMLADAGPEAAGQLRPLLPKMYEDSQKIYERMLKSAAGNLPSLQKVMQMYKEGKSGEDWYLETRAELEAHFGKHAEIFLNFLAATSPNQTVAGNVTMALKAYHQWINGQPFTGFLVATNPKTGEVTMSVPAMLEKIARGEEFGGRKVKSFNANIFGDPIPVTVDRWISRAFGLGDSPTEAQYKFIDYAITQAAKRKGIEPRQMQAAIWKTIKEAVGKKGNTSDPFEVVLRKRLEADPVLREEIRKAVAAAK